MLALQTKKSSYIKKEKIKKKKLFNINNLKFMICLTVLILL